MKESAAQLNSNYESQQVARGLESSTESQFAFKQLGASRTSSSSRYLRRETLHEQGWNLTCGDIPAGLHCVGGSLASHHRLRTPLPHGYRQHQHHLLCTTVGTLVGMSWKPPGICRQTRRDRQWDKHTASEPCTCYSALVRRFSVRGEADSLRLRYKAGRRPLMCRSIASMDR